MRNFLGKFSLLFVSPSPFFFLYMRPFFVHLFACLSAPLPSFLPSCFRSLFSPQHEKSQMRVRSPERPRHLLTLNHDLSPPLPLPFLSLSLLFAPLYPLTKTPVVSVPTTETTSHASEGEGWLKNFNIHHPKYHQSKKPLPLTRLPPSLSSLASLTLGDTSSPLQSCPC